MRLGSASEPARNRRNPAAAIIAALSVDSARLGIDAAGIGRGPHAIHIVVNGARILLLGQVKTTGDRRIAEASLRTLSGVLGVNNQLRVAGQP